MKKKRRILFVTERRADYSRFKPILEEIRKDPDLDYILIVTGDYLLNSVGHLTEIIEKDGFKISARVPMFNEAADDTGASMAKAFGRVMLGLTDEIERLKPDLIFAGFDISANLAAAMIGAYMNIPCAHIQGGEVTGTIDESLRHAMTKFCQIHFPSNEDAKNRLIKMGENSKYIFTVGCPSLDLIRTMKFIPKEELEREFGIDLSKPFVIILQHPVTTEDNEAAKQISITLEAIKELNIPAILIYPNIDAGGKRIIEEIEKTKIKRYNTLSFEKFVSLLRYTSALVGNSSCGIHETSTLHVPTVNIGTRQRGRLRPKNVIDVSYDKEEIKKAIKKALYDEKFKKIVKNCKNPYGDGKSAKRVVRILREIDIGLHMVQKRITY